MPPAEGSLASPDASPALRPGEASLASADVLRRLASNFSSDRLFTRLLVSAAKSRPSVQLPLAANRKPKVTGFQNAAEGSVLGCFSGIALAKPALRPPMFFGALRLI